MASTDSAGSTPLMGEFLPISSLWEGDHPLYPSEVSARWAYRQLSAALAAHEAIAVHRGRIFIHPGKFAEVVRRQSLASANRRYLTTAQT